jgi:hypothetical protein
VHLVGFEERREDYEHFAKIYRSGMDDRLDRLPTAKAWLARRTASFTSEKACLLPEDVNIITRIGDLACGSCKGSSCDNSSCKGCQSCSGCDGCRLRAAIVDQIIRLLNTRPSGDRVYRNKVEAATLTKVRDWNSLLLSAFAFFLRHGIDFFCASRRMTTESRI